ncbi:MAG: glycosyltransferase [Candidatus Verstraetearchaeota archaeon]|nr:glycosyltransferase [Candidatus Verstraetearchaeota archaeon]
MAEKALSVIIPTYNEEKFIGRCLRALLIQTLPKELYEIIVVDGYSTDRTREIASRYADKVILQARRGVGGARNDGAEAACGEILVFTDADTIAPRNRLERIWSWFKENPDLCAVCGPDLPLDGGRVLAALYRGINWFSRITALMGFPGTRGTNTAVRREVFLKVGGYTDYPLCDDVELGLRLRKLCRVQYDPGLIMYMSSRRFRKYGVMKVLKDWIRGDVFLLLGRRTHGSYQRQQY